MADQFEGTRSTKKEPPTCAGGSWSFMAPRVGFEPTTLRLTAGCSAVELPRNFFGALRFLGARKYYRHFNLRRNPLFQKFFQQPNPRAWLIRNLIRTLRFRYRTQPDMYGSGEQGMERKLFAESWLRMRRSTASTPPSPAHRPPFTLRQPPTIAQQHDSAAPWPPPAAKRHRP